MGVDMKKLLLILAVLVVPGIAQAQLKSEPPPGTLPAGKSVLVDDGTCGPGKIKKITGGSDTSLKTGQRIAGGGGRQRTCVKKP